jgi:flagellar basal body P-ring formation protein FlgA
MKRLLLASLALAFVGNSVEAATLRTMTTLHAPTVRLADLFDDAGANAQRVLGPGPGPGGRIVVEAPQLAAIARQFGVDWRPASPADRAVLERAGRPLPREDTIDAVRAALIAAGASTDCDIELAAFSPPLVPLEAKPRPVVSDLDYDAAGGRFSALLSIAGEAMEPIAMRVGGRVDDMMELPVTTRRLAAGAVIGNEDVHLGRVRTSLVHGEVVYRPADAVGLQLRHPVVAGQPLAVGELVRPSLVQRGANVLMVLESAGIALTAQGQALEAGASGERIRVLNPSSHAVVEAEVTGAGSVRVSPGSLPVTPAANVR